MSNLNVLVLEDDVVYQRILTFHLSSEGYKVRVTGSVAEFWSEFERSKPDLLLVDIHLPDGTGFGVLHKVREYDLQMPIVVVSGLDKPIERELTYHSGADVFLAKPIHVNELLAIVKRLSVRIYTGSTLSLSAWSEPEVQQWTLLKSGSVLISPSGERLPLSAMEFAFLALLVKAGAEVSRKSVLEHFGKTSESIKGNGGAINTMVSRLKKRWFNQHNNELPLHSVRGIGYRFVDERELVMQNEVRTDNIGRVLLYHFTCALMNEKPLTDVERLLIKSFYKAIRASIADFHLQHSNQICKHVIGPSFRGDNQEVSSRFDKLLQSDVSTVQCLLIMSRFAQFVLESPCARLSWLIDFLHTECKNSTDSSLSDDGLFLTKEGTFIIVDYIRRIYIYMQKYFDQDVFFSIVKSEVPFVDLRFLLNQVLIELNIYLGVVRQSANDL